MILTHVQKKQLLAKHLPVLLLSVDDLGPPVDPSQFVRASALWCSNAPELDNKLKWGLSDGCGVRKPIVPRGSLDLAGLTGRMATEFRNAGELWLDCGGWIGGLQVANGIDNREPNFSQLKQLFGFNVEPVLSAEVCCADTWQTIPTAVTERSTGLPADELTNRLKNYVIINYQMLFSGHNAFNMEDYPDGRQYASADFEGDWVCFSVLLTTENGSEDPADLRPVWAHFERRFRNQSDSFGAEREVRRFESHPWANIPKLADQPAVLVALGSHNLYPPDVATTPTGQVSVQSGTFGYADNIVDDMKKWADGITKKNRHTAASVLGVVLAKMSAGAMIAGPIGAFAGLVAGIAEAEPIAKAIGKDPGPPSINPEDTKPFDSKIKDPKDKFKSDTATTKSFIVIGGESQSDQELLQVMPPGSSIDRRLQWSGRTLEPVDRKSENYWPTYNLQMSTGYTGRWGVRCDDDPFNRRAGALLPDYRMEVLRNIIDRIS